MIDENPIPEEEFIPKELTSLINNKVKILLEYFLFQQPQLFQKNF